MFFFSIFLSHSFDSKLFYTNFGTILISTFSSALPSSFYFLFQPLHSTPTNILLASCLPSNWKTNEHFGLCKRPRRRKKKPQTGKSDFHIKTNCLINKISSNISLGTNNICQTLKSNPNTFKYINYKIYTPYTRCTLCTRCTS